MIYKWYLVFLNLIHTIDSLNLELTYNKIHCTTQLNKSADYCLSLSIIFNLLKYIRVNSLGVYCALNCKTNMGILYGRGVAGVALPKHLTSNHTKKIKNGPCLNGREGVFYSYLHVYTLTVNTFYSNHCVQKGVIADNLNCKNVVFP